MSNSYEVETKTGNVMAIHSKEKPLKNGEPLGGCSGWLSVGGEGPQKEKNAKTVLRCKVKLEFKYVFPVCWSGRQSSSKPG
jgi:hypothetical protein